MERILEKIDNLFSTFSKLLPFRHEDLQRLNKKIRLEFNYNSNHLEGNTLTYSETELLLGIEELFREFEQQHRRFYDMFYSVKFYFYKNNNAKRTLEELTAQIESIISSSQTAFVEAEKAPEAGPEPDTYKSISAGIHLSDYKYNEKAPFGISSVLYVDLQPYHYSIVCDDKEVIRKKYDEYLNADERKL